MQIFLGYLALSEKEDVRKFYIFGNPRPAPNLSIKNDKKNNLHYFNELLKKGGAYLCMLPVFLILPVKNLKTVNFNEKNK